jgi:hypothetical protein
MAGTEDGPLLTEVEEGKEAFLTQVDDDEDQGGRDTPTLFSRQSSRSPPQFEHYSVHLSEPDNFTDDELDRHSEDGADDGYDKVFEEIRRSLSKMGEGSSRSKRSTHSIDSGSTVDEEEETLRTSSHFTNVPYGIQPRDTYEHDKKSNDIMGGKFCFCPFSR